MAAFVAGPPSPTSRGFPLPVNGSVMIPAVHLYGRGRQASSAMSGCFRVTNRHKQSGS